MSEMPWWRDAVVYQVYPRSFADGDGDGVGDLPGLTSQLDYLAWLGVDAIWISPIYPSPMVDGGYDVTDYQAIDPTYGDLDDFDRMLTEAHARGIRVLMDWVPNHTSDLHPWFIESRASRDSPKRDWYFWRDGTPDRPPNNWKAAFGRKPAWTYDAPTEQMYLHLFFPQQPDLNWNNPEVVKAMHGTLRFWLDRGVDGFRVDVVHCIGKNPDLPDQPAALADVDQVAIHDYEGTHPLICGFRKLLDSYPGDRMMVGEVSLRVPGSVGRYYGESCDELHLAFNFMSLDVGWSAKEWTRVLDRVPTELNAADWPTWVLSNHDVTRHRTRLGGSRHRARTAAMLLLTLRGTPFLYYGEELGMEEASVSADQTVDQGGRDGCRAPMAWTAAADHGWTGATPPIPFGPHADDRNVETLTADQSSILHLYRRLLAVRRRSPALRRGRYEELLGPPGVLAYRRVDGHHDGADRRLVVINFDTRDAEADFEGDWVVQVCTREAYEEAAYTGVVPGESGLILAPAGT